MVSETGFFVRGLQWATEGGKVHAVAVGDDRALCNGLRMRVPPSAVAFDVDEGRACRSCAAIIRRGGVSA